MRKTTHAPVLDAGINDRLCRSDDNGSTSSVATAADDSLRTETPTQHPVMPPARWQQITELFHAAIARQPATRDAFLQDACDGDSELRAGVQQLLAAHDHAGQSEDVPQFGLSQAGRYLDDADDDIVAFDTFAPGTYLADRFLIVRSIGNGGMGMVYEAIDRKIDRHVALKCALPGYTHRLAPEVRAAREVSHFNVCKIYDLHSISTETGEIDILSMEFIDGETLSQRLVRDGPLAPSQAREIARQICEGLAQAHRQDVIHGDLKCANVILGTTPQGSVRAVITDFGLAQLKSDIDNGNRGGTRIYMAPELMRGRSTTASDIYALGVVMQAMLLGEPGGSEDLRLQDFPSLERLPTPWRTLVARCLQPSPEDRPVCVEEVCRALQPSQLWWKVTAAAVGLSGIVAFGLWPAPPEALGSPVRLVVLPLAAATDGGDAAQASSVAASTNVSNRLAGLRSNFTVIAPSEARSNQVDSPDKGVSVLGATHALDTRVRVSGSEVIVTSSLLDLHSGRRVRELSGSYPSRDPRTITTALVGMVTEAFRLPVGNSEDLVIGPAGASYAEGIGLLRESSTNSAKAIAHFQQAARLDPWSALPHAGLAEAQLQLFETEGGRHWLDDASDSVDKAKALNAAAVPVLFVSGTLAQQFGRYEDAIRDFNRVVELAPTNAEAWRRLAMCYERTNRTDDVAITYEKAIAAQPGYYRHYLSFGNFYLTRGQFARAEVLYRKVTDVAPGLGAGHESLGLALMQQGHYSDAEGSLLTALSIRQSAGLLLNLGALYYAQEQYDEALHFFEHSLSVGQPTVIRYLNKGDAYRHLRRVGEAADAYGKAMDLAELEVGRNPRQASLRVFLGLAAAQRGDRRRAVSEFLQSVSMEPDNTIVIRQAAIGYEVLGQRDDTLRLLARAPRTLLEELARQPDMKGLQRDQRFVALLNSDHH
jgi:tetratricopeptide (TPR) repeat protein/tRNA A-37 threonylcarbamoyl transferase component Bud32